MKKIVLSILSGLLAATSVYASPLAGTYVGAGIGVNHGSIKASRFQGKTFMSGTQFGSHGPVGILRLGHGFVSNNMYLGLEVNGSVGHLNMVSRDVTASSKASFKSKYNWGFSVRPGILLTPNTRACVHLGLNRQKINFRDEALNYKHTISQWTPTTGFSLGTAINPCTVVDVSFDSSLGRKASFGPKTSTQDIFKVRTVSSSVTANVTRIFKPESK